MHTQPLRTRSQRQMTVFTFCSHISSATETAVPQPRLVRQARHFFVMDTAVTYNLCESDCTPDTTLTAWEICSWAPYQLCLWPPLLDQNFISFAGLIYAPQPPPLSKIPSLTAGLMAKYKQPLGAVNLHSISRPACHEPKRVTIRTKAGSAASHPRRELSRNLRHVGFPLNVKSSFFDILSTPITQQNVGITVLPEYASFSSFLNVIKTQNMFKLYYFQNPGTHGPAWCTQAMLTGDKLFSVPWLWIRGLMHAIISAKIPLLICGNFSTFGFIKLLPNSDHNEETQLRHSSWLTEGGRTCAGEFWLPLFWS